MGKNFLLTAFQREWVRMEMKLLKLVPIKTQMQNSNWIKRNISIFVTHKYFEVGVFVLINANTLILTMN